MSSTSFNIDKIAETYQEKMQEIKYWKLEKECLTSLKKVVKNLSKARVEYMSSGSNTPILRSIFELEKQIFAEMNDIESLENGGFSQ